MGNSKYGITTKAIPVSGLMEMIDSSGTAKDFLREDLTWNLYIGRY